MSEAQGFGGPADQWKQMEREIDFRVDSRERCTGGLLDALEKSLEE